MGGLGGEEEGSSPSRLNSNLIGSNQASQIDRWVNFSSLSPVKLETGKKGATLVKLCVFLIFSRSEFYEFCMDEMLGTHVNAPSMYLPLNHSLTADNLPLRLMVNVPGQYMKKIPLNYLNKC